jgi:hypothetical protein
MLAANTLMALACLLGNKDRLDTSPIERQLTADEQAIVQKYVEAGACLPKELEKKVQETNEKILKGTIGNISSDSHPTHDCD